MSRFKVGDWVRIVRLSGNAEYSSMASANYQNYIGSVCKIKGVEGHRYILDINGPCPWLEDELELDKGRIVKQIIDDL